MKVWLPYAVGGSGTDVFTESFASSLEEAGHSAVAQPFPHWTQFVSDVLRFARAPRGTDVVLTNSINGFAFRISGVPLVTVAHHCVHDPEYAPFRTRAQAVYHNTLVRSFERRSFSTADRVVSVSYATQRAVEAVFSGIETKVIPNGVDTTFFSPGTLQTRSGQNDPFRLLFVGNLTARKGADLLPSVMAELGSRFELQYTSGLRGGAILDIENAIPLGRPDLIGLRAAYREADVLLCPSRLEGGPLVVLEAMACGLPVVGSDRSAMPEAVVEGETGFLCDLDPSKLAEAVRTLAADAALQEKMSRAARSRAVDEFGVDLMVDRYLAMFRGLLS